MERFWSMTVQSEEPRTDLYITDEIAGRRSWFGDEITPKAFKRDLDQANGTLYVWLDSPGGDAFAGSAIYDMLREYSATRGKVVAMVSLAASAASIIAMAADEIRISVLGTMMIHRPWSRPTGNSAELRAVADALDTIAEAQVDAYARRTGQSREKVTQLLLGPDGNGTYMNARMAMEYGFADSIMHGDGEDADAQPSAFMKSLTEVRIASCLAREEARMRELTEGCANSRAAKDDSPFIAQVEATLESWTMAKMWEFVSMIERAGDRGDIMDAVAWGIRAGLARWDAIQARAGKGEHDEADDGRAALAAALAATEDIKEEPESEVE